MAQENTLSTSKIYKNTSVSRGLLAEQERAIRLNLILHVITFLPVILVAVFSGSILLYSDIVDYFKSIVTSFISWHILWRIQRGRAQEYDYGHGKMESFGGVLGAIIFIAGLMFAAGFAFHRLFNPAELHFGYTALGAVIQIAGFVLNGWLWWRNRKLAIQSGSPLLEMQWRTNRADALSNLAVVVALILSLGLRSYPWHVYIDPACALIFVLYAAASFIPGVRDGIQDLMDKTLSEDLQLKVLRCLADNYSSYEAFYGVRSRRAGHQLFIEISLGFSPEKTVGEVMDTIDSLKEKLEQDIPHSEVNIILKSMKQLNSS